MTEAIPFGNPLCGGEPGVLGQNSRNTRTYIYDVDEKYVIVLEPRRDNTAYFLLTAYHLEGKDAARDKIINKYRNRRLPKLI